MDASRGLFGDVDGVFILQLHAGRRPEGVNEVADIRAAFVESGAVRDQDAEGVAVL
jgi:hypothetical protein